MQHASVCLMLRWALACPSTNILMCTVYTSMKLYRCAIAHHIHGWSVKHVDACCKHGETNVTWWHGSRQSHRDDLAHNIAWICTYDNRLECIPILQGQELSWLERVTHVNTRVHHTKCTITHTHAGINHAQCYHTKQESKSDIANIPSVWPNKIQEM